MGAFRCLLALSVVAAHTKGILGLQLVDGMSAVQIFFAISGFYMALILNEKYVGPGSYSAFVKNRILRIYPLYIVVALITAIFVLFVKSTVKTSDIADIMNVNLWAALLVCVSNIIIVGQDIVMFVGLDGSSFTFVKNFRAYDIQLWQYLLVPQAWSLSLELMFYAIAPFIVRSVWRTIVVVLLSAAGRLILRHAGLTSDPWTFRLFPTELCFFLLGSLGYHIRRLSQFQQWSPRLSVLAMFGMGLSVFSFGKVPWPVSYALMIGGIPILFDLTRANRFDRLLGELSFPIYLIHYFVIMVAEALVSGGSEIRGLGTYVTAATIPLSVVAYVLIVVPIDHMREERWTPPRRAAAAPVTA